MNDCTAAPLPTWRFMLAHPAHAVALGFGAGLSAVAPGTVGTLWAWLVYALALRHLGPLAMGLVLALGLLAGWWACTVTARHLRVPDPGCIVWDEIVAFWLLLWLAVPAGPGAQLAAFALFRGFDAAKPPPVCWADRYFKNLGWRGGWGIMFDDLVAALCALAVWALGRYVLGVMG